MTLQQLMSPVRRAIDDYKMIEDGDKIAVGLSGGKDSLALLCALNGIKRFYPNKFDLVAITVDMGLNYDETEKKNSELADTGVGKIEQLEKKNQELQNQLAKVCEIPHRLDMIENAIRLMAAARSDEAGN